MSNEAFDIFNPLNIRITRPLATLSSVQYDVPVISTQSDHRKYGTKRSVKILIMFRKFVIINYQPAICAKSACAFVYKGFLPLCLIHTVCVV